MNKKIHGIIAAMVTPMDAAETVNLVGASASDGSADCEQVFTACFALEPMAKHMYWKKRKSWKSSANVAEQANGRVPVLAGTGCVSTKASAALAREAEKLGARCSFSNQPMVCRQLLRRNFTGIL